MGQLRTPRLGRAASLTPAPISTTGSPPTTKDPGFRQSFLPLAGSRPSSQGWLSGGSLGQAPAEPVPLATFIAFDNWACFQALFTVHWSGCALQTVSLVFFCFSTPWRTLGSISVLAGSSAPVLKKSPRDLEVTGWRCHEQGKGPWRQFLDPPRRTAEAVCPGQRLPLSSSCTVSPEKGCSRLPPPPSTDPQEGRWGQTHLGPPCAG